MATSFLVLAYAQYRPASYDTAVAIGERREERFPMSEGVEREIKAFLEKGAVRCGAALHRRKVISTHLQKPLIECLSPLHEVVPPYEGA